MKIIYHAYSNKVSTSLFGTDVNPRRDEPLKLLEA